MQTKPRLQASRRLAALLAAALFALAGGAGLSACGEDKEGPGEDAGKAIDQAGREAGEELDNAGDKAGKEIDQAEKEAEKEVNDKKGE